MLLPIFCMLCGFSEKNYTHGRKWEPAIIDRVKSCQLNLFLKTQTLVNNTGSP